MQVLNAKKFSIIVTGNENEATLSEFFLSVFNNNKEYVENIELIFINISQKKSIKILFEYWKNKFPYSLILINRGSLNMEKVQKRALLLAKNEWVTFMNSSDFIDCNYFMNVNQVISCYDNGDIFFCRPHNYNKINKTTDLNDSEYLFKFNDKYHVFDIRDRISLITTSNSFFLKKSILLKNEIYSTESLPMLLKYIKKSNNKSITLVKDAHYYIREKSSDEIKDIINNFIKLFEWHLKSAIALPKYIEHNVLHFLKPLLIDTNFKNSICIEENKLEIYYLMKHINDKSMDDLPRHFKLAEKRLIKYNYYPHLLETITSAEICCEASTFLIARLTGAKDRWAINISESDKKVEDFSYKRMKDNNTNLSYTYILINKENMISEKIKFYYNDELIHTHSLNKKDKCYSHKLGNVDFMIIPSSSNNLSYYIQIHDFLEENYKNDKKIVFVNKDGELDEFQADNPQYAVIDYGSRNFTMMKEYCNNVILSNSEIMLTDFLSIKRSKISAMKIICVLDNQEMVKEMQFDKIIIFDKEMKNKIIDTTHVFPEQIHLFSENRNEIFEEYFNEK